MIFWSQSEDGVLPESTVTECEDPAESTGNEGAGSVSVPEGTGMELTDGYYRVAGHEDLQYLIYKEAYAANSGEEIYAAYTEDGEANETDCCFLMKFVCFDSEEYAYSDVLSLVYQINSAEDIARILVKPSRADNTDAGKLMQEQIGEHTVTDEEEIETFYEILSSLICYGGDRWNLIDRGDWDIPADSSVNNAQTYLPVWFERYLTVTTGYGNEIDGLKYTAYSDMFFEFGGIAYSSLNEEQAEQVCGILGIKADDR